MPINQANYVIVNSTLLIHFFLIGFRSYILSY